MLELAVDGATKSYLLEHHPESSTDLIEHWITTLVRYGFLNEISDVNRTYVTYKTSRAGVAYLKMHRKIHTAYGDSRIIIDA